MKNCSICLEKIDKNLFKLSCNHFFHKLCIDKWIETCNYKFKCPICRKKYISLRNNYNYNYNYNYDFIEMSSFNYDYIEISSLSELYIFAIIYLVFFIIVLRNILN